MSAEHLPKLQLVFDRGAYFRDFASILQLGNGRGIDFADFLTILQLGNGLKKYSARFFDNISAWKVFPYDQLEILPEISGRASPELHQLELLPDNLGKSPT